MIKNEFNNQEHSNKSVSFGTLGLILGCVGFVSCGITAIPGLIISIYGLKKSNIYNQNCNVENNTPAIIGIVICSFEILCWPLSLILAGLSK